MEADREGTTAILITGARLIDIRTNWIDPADGRTDGPSYPSIYSI